jgi:hypothetical protein
VSRRRFAQCRCRDRGPCRTGEYGAAARPAAATAARAAVIKELEAERSELLEDQ